MLYDIVPIQSRYRGMERGLTTEDIWTSKAREKYDELLEIYYAYLDCILEESDENILGRLILIYNEFTKYDVLCEIIAYDICPISEIAGCSIEFLGIDIVHDMCESLISGEVRPCIEHLLNKNGLCSAVGDIEKIIPFQDHGNVEWKPCYVYKVNVEAC